MVVRQTDDDTHQANTNGNTETKYGKRRRKKKRIREKTKKKNGSIPATAIVIGQTGDDTHAAGQAGLGAVHVKDALVVRLAVLGENLLDQRVQGVAVRLGSLLDQANTAKWLDGALERRIGLETKDELGDVLVDDARLVGKDHGRGLGVAIKHALLDLLLEQLGAMFPQFGGALSGALNEVRVAIEPLGVVEHPLLDLHKKVKEIRRHSPDKIRIT